MQETQLTPTGLTHLDQLREAARDRPSHLAWINLRVAAELDGGPPIPPPLSTKLSAPAAADIEADVAAIIAADRRQAVSGVEPVGNPGTAYLQRRARARRSADQARRTYAARLQGGGR